ncbi:MAG TPA: phosphotyrosine protein phosphatase [Candidatus Kapabacteria bacterium]|nr:phosphotyrosine protein phosphatase [Candidatus Kapabacteria bacterium]
MNTGQILFVCGRDRLRSPTAEQVFATWPGVEGASAGLNPDSENPLTPDLLTWADTIIVMEKAHRSSRLRKHFGAYVGTKRVVCLDIPDRYDYMEPALAALLRARVPRHLP